MFTTQAYVDDMTGRIRCGHVDCSATLGHYDDGRVSLGAGRGWNLGHDGIWHLAAGVKRRIERLQRLADGAEGQQEAKKAKAALGLVTAGDLRALSQSDPHLDVDFGDATTRATERAGSGDELTIECWQCGWINSVANEE